MIRLPKKNWMKNVTNQINIPNFLQKLEQKKSSWVKKYSMHLQII